MRLTLLAAACLLSAPTVHAQATDAARRLAQDAIIVDTHIDAPGVLEDKWADLANEHKDYRTLQVLNWFVKEQEKRRKTQTT